MTMTTTRSLELKVVTDVTPRKNCISHRQKEIFQFTVKINVGMRRERAACFVVWARSVLQIEGLSHALLQRHNWQRTGRRHYPPTGNYGNFSCFPPSYWYHWQTRQKSYQSQPTRHFAQFAEDVINVPENPFEKCWAADSWSVNGADDLFINALLGCFNSPAPPAFYALTTALEKAGDNSDEKMETLQLFTRMLKPECYFVVKRGDDDEILEWTINSPRSEAFDENNQDGWEMVEGMHPFSSAIQIAHHLLELATEASSRHERLATSTMDTYVDLMIKRLKTTLGTETRGRSAADAAFALAVTGVTRTEIYDILLDIAHLELSRMGGRPSLPARNILQIVEKLAAAGLRGSKVERTYELAAELLSHKKDCPDVDVIKALRSKKGFGMHSTRSLLWLWRFAARQTKAKLPGRVKREAGGENDEVLDSFIGLDCASWTTRYDDPNRPLVVDIGCGMGISILGLSNEACSEMSDRLIPHLVDFSACNFVGGDLNSLAVGFGSGISTRWGLQGRTQFVHQTAEELLRQIQKSYPGPVSMIMIQFPTPFKLATRESTKDGNSQLPSGTDTGFMVTPRLLEAIKQILQGRSCDSIPKPYLLMQSNCEDVALAMRDMALEAGLRSVDVISPVQELRTDKKLPLRTLEWIEAGRERPIGMEWSREAILPRYGQTETEVACDYQGTPVHRTILTV